MDFIKEIIEKVLNKIATILEIDAPTELIEKVLIAVLGIALSMIIMILMIKLINSIHTMIKTHKEN